MKMKRVKLVYVEWLDSQGVTSGWQDFSHYKPSLPVMRSCGWVVHEDKSSISLCASIGDETPTTLYQGNGIMTIPKICILSKKVIKN